MRFQRGNVPPPPPARGRESKRIQAEYDWARMSSAYNPPAAPVAPVHVEMTPELRKCVALYVLSVRGTAGERVVADAALGRMMRRHMIELSTIKNAAESEGHRV